jgi:protein ImuB
MVDPAIVFGLRRAGLKTIGDVAARARHELASRFGGAFVTALDRTLGREDEPISPRHPLPDCMAERRFAEPVVTDDVVADTILALAESIAGLLEKRGEGARQLEAAFFRADGQMRRIAIAMARPTRDPRVAARLFHEKLDALANPLDPGFGFDLIRLSAVTTEPLNPQATSFDSRENEKKGNRFPDRPSCGALRRDAGAALPAAGHAYSRSRVRGAARAIFHPFETAMGSCAHRAKHRAGLCACSRSRNPSK